MKLNWDEFKNILFKFCQENNRICIAREEYEGIKIGNWIQHQKKKINSIEDDLYKKLSENKYVKESLDKYLKKI